MRRQEARVGSRVRVVDGRRVPHLLDQTGTVEKIYRTPGRTALHVRLDDGRWQLLWPEEVEPVGRQDRPR